MNNNSQYLLQQSQIVHEDEFWLELEEEDEELFDDQLRRLLERSLLLTLQRYLYLLYFPWSRRSRRSRPLLYFSLLRYWSTLLRSFSFDEALTSFFSICLVFFTLPLLSLLYFSSQLLVGLSTWTVIQSPSICPLFMCVCAASASSFALKLITAQCFTLGFCLMPIECISPKLENIYFMCASVRLGDKFPTVIEVNFTLSWEEEESEELEEEESEDECLGIRFLYNITNAIQRILLTKLYICWKYCQYGEQFQLVCNKLINKTAMMESLVDYVLERGRVDFGQFAPRNSLDPTSALYNHRKLLAYLFEQDERTDKKQQQKLAKRISDLKIEEISGQLNYFSQKIHAELSKKHLVLDGDLYKVENEWLRKKIPDFYCYYFLKFAYANSYTRMHELFLSELENMSKEKDSYQVIKKTIEARESCLHNLRRVISTVKDLDIEESLHTIQEEREMRRKMKIVKEHGDYKHKQKGEEGGKSWKNELQLVFQNINHLRKLTCYVTELIRIWRVNIYGISDDPRRYRERVIFYNNDANYLLKMLFDSNFIRECFLKRYLQFSKGFDPFCLKPAMLLDNKPNRNETEDIFLELIRPSELDMDKITKCLVVLAQEEYDEDQQSRFINERKNYGELQQRKQFIEKRRDSLGLKKNQSEKALPEKAQQKQYASTNPQNIKQVKAVSAKKDAKIIEFTNDKKSGNTQKQIEQVQSQREDSRKRSRIETSLNRLKQMRASDLKKVSPYLSRNQRIQKAQKVIQLQHKFRVAQSQYVQSTKKKREEQSKEKIKSSIQANKETLGSKIFNRYIEENLKMMEEANKKSFLYKNNLNANQNRVASSHNYNKIPFVDRKEAQYERNLEKYYPKETQSPKKKVSNNGQAKGTRAVIEISNKGVKANEKIIQFQLTNRKGKNVGEILNAHDKGIQREQTNKKLSPKLQKGDSESKEVNLYQTQKQGEILIIRQQPEKIEEIKQFLYVKIKEQLMEEMKRNQENKEIQLNNMLEEEKRRKLQEIMEQRRLEEQRRKEEEQRQRLARLDRQRKKLSFEIRVEPIQYAQQNIDPFLSEILSIDATTYNRLFTTQKIQVLKEQISQQFYYVILKGYYENKEQGYCIYHFQWEYQLHRKLVIDYIVTRQSHLFMSNLHRAIDYLWNHDPVQQIELVVYCNLENVEGAKVFQDLQNYTQQTGQIFEKQLYSNITQVRLIWMRPSSLTNIQFPFDNYHFSKKLTFKAQLLSAAFSLSERHAPIIEMTLEVFTNYIFLLEQLFRRFLTPQEVVELRQNSTNIRRLKDIFRIVLQLEKTSPIVDELVVVQGLNLDDLYTKLKDKKMAPYEPYYWHHFYDRTLSNRLLLSVLQMRPQIKFPIQSCYLNDRRFLRINCRQKVLTLRSSIYAQNIIYILDTHLPKIKIFLMEGEHYKLMRMELFVFLNLIFNNIIEDTQRFVNSIWVPQFCICDGNSGKQVKRITDFSISMKKSFYLSEEIYFANHQYVKHAVSLLPRQADIIFRESIIFGYLHGQVEQASTGMPLYAKLIDKGEMFT